MKKNSINYAFRKKNLFFFIIFFLFFLSFSSLSLSLERSTSLFLTPDRNVNDDNDVRELPLVHNVYILFAFFCFLATIFFLTFFLKEKKEDYFIFGNDLNKDDKTKSAKNQKKLVEDPKINLLESIDNSF